MAMRYRVFDTDARNGSVAEHVKEIPCSPHTGPSLLVFEFAPATLIEPSDPGIAKVGAGRMGNHQIPLIREQ